MKNKENSDKSEKKLRKIKLILDIIFLLVMSLLLDLFETLLSMNKVWMQLIFVALYAVFWQKASEFLLPVIQSRIVNKTENE
ncbi:MAG: hypothetical protein LUF35_01855 [Lachnospiraceae bacterium]|nr:hypothetical protein [Lachnospiraceae bacterium]